MRSPAASAPAKSTKRTDGNGTNVRQKEERKKRREEEGFSLVSDLGVSLQHAAPKQNNRYYTYLSLFRIWNLKFRCIYYILWKSSGFVAVVWSVLCGGAFGTTHFVYFTSIIEHAVVTAEEKKGRDGERYKCRAEENENATERTHQIYEISNIRCRRTDQEQNRTEKNSPWFGRFGCTRWKNALFGQLHRMAAAAT